MVICSNDFILNCLSETKRMEKEGARMGQDEGEREVTVYSVSPPLSGLGLGTCHWLTHLIFTTLRGQNACSKFTDDKTMNQRGWASLGAPQWGWDAEDCWNSIPKVNFYLLCQGCFCNFIFLNHLLILKDLYFLETKLLSLRRTSFSSIYVITRQGHVVLGKKGQEEKQPKI